MRKKTVYRISGQVTNSHSSHPLSGLHIRAYDQDLIWDDCLGNDNSNDQGNFTICFFEHDFKELFEGQPEIYIVVYGSNKKQIYRTKPKQLKVGETEIFFNIPIDDNSLLTDLRISHVVPEKVLPGTFVEVYGDNFGDIYQNVIANVGGREALVLDVSPQKLTIRIPPERGSLDPLSISVKGRATTASGLLQYRDPPREGIVGEIGAPETFSGADDEGNGLSNVGSDQRVLIIMCYPSDKDATIGGLTEIGERQRQIDAFEKLVNPSFRQMSFNRTDFDFDYTNWLTLPEEDDFYFWRQSDEDAAQSALDDLPADATEAEIDAAEAALQIASNKIATPQEQTELYHDAVKMAQDDGWTLADYSGIMLCLATDHLRGRASGTWNSVTDSDGDTITLATNTYLWLISYTSHWGRRVHELSHAIATGDLYSGLGIIADGEKWDMMGSHNRMPLFSGYNMVEKLGWYQSEDDVANPADANIKLLSWGSSSDHDQVYTVRAHDTVEDNQSNLFHLIKLSIFPGLTYYVEVRQEPSALPTDLDATSDSASLLIPAANAAEANANQLLFDTHIVFPGSEPSHKGGVIVTKSVDDDSNLNQKVRKITLLSPNLMQAGEEVVDAARRLSIQVESKTNDRPLTYTIRVKWVDVADADPNGLFNLRIRPWDSSWQTNDIWVDSEANGWDTYETSLESGTGNPLGNGDRPWVGHSNRIYARIYNDGTIPVSDVQTTFYVNNPPAIGDNGTWVPHAVRTIPNIGAGSSESVYANWHPTVGEHTCLKVAVETQLGEVNVNDNEAQENVFSFDTSGSSPHQPIFFEVNVQNPLPKWSLIYMHPRGLPLGWEATVENGWLWLPPLGERKMRLTLFTDNGRTNALTKSLRAQQDRDFKIPPEISFKLDGAAYRWYGEGPNKTGQAEHLEAIGGIQVKARARRLVKLTLEVDADRAKNGSLSANGWVDVKLENIEIKLEITNPDGRHRIVSLKTDQSGLFLYNSRKLEHTLMSGNYSLQAFIIANSFVGDSESETIDVEVPVLF